MFVDPLASDEVRTLPPIERKASEVASTGMLASRKKPIVASVRKRAIVAPAAGTASLRFDLRAATPQRRVTPPRRPRKTGTKPEDWLGIASPIEQPSSPPPPPSRPKRSAETEELADSARRIRNYAKLLAEQSLHHFIIWKGKKLSSTPEFAAFRRRYATRWTNISRIVSLLEDLCLKHGVPLAVVDGPLVDALAKCDLQCLKVADLRACIHNVDAADDGNNDDAAVKTRKDHDEPVKSAIVIQAVVRRNLARDQVRRLTTKLAAAVRVQASYRRHAAENRVLVGLAARRAARDARWLELVTHLKKHSACLARGRARLEIHLPSLGYAEAARLRMPQFKRTQALQVARLCAATDPAVHVVYVSPVPLSAELVDYWRHVLALGNDDTHNFTIVVPDDSSFPEHTSLARLVVFSHACCRRLKRLVAEKGFAVIVPSGPIGWAERWLAVEIGVPLLGPDPPAAALYTSRSGAKSLLHSADVNIPIGAHDIYESDDLIVALAKLIAGHLDVPRWIVAVDAPAFGLAALDVDALPVVLDLRADFQRLVALDRRKGEAAWRHPDVQTMARTKLLKALRADLPTKAKIARSQRWSAFLADLRRYGAVVEAEPSRVVARQAVHACVRPDGALSSPIAQETLLDDNYDTAAFVYPQSAAPIDALTRPAAAVAARLFANSVVGYFTLHLVTYRTHDDKLRIWATGLDLGLTPAIVGHQLHATITSSSVRDDDDEPAADAAYLLIPRLYHDGLTSMDFPAFFQLCREHAVNFSLRRRQGTVFVLVDSLAAGLLGALLEAPSRLQVLVSGFKLLVFVKRHCSSRQRPRCSDIDDDDDLCATELQLPYVTDLISRKLQTEANATTPHDKALVSLLVRGQRG